jgi:hypothetical protein
MSRSETLLKSIENFYSTEDSKNSEYLRDILEKRKGISLRNLEWFITTYSKHNNLTYTTKNGNSFAVHCAYKSSLDGYSKKLFDPFCRTEKFKYEIPNTKGIYVQTTVAQLNFIKWCITNNIIDYLIDNNIIQKKKKSKPIPHNHSYTEKFDIQ